MSVLENLKTVEKKIQSACIKAGRARDEVTLIAVSKTKPVSLIEELLPAGILDFGENKAQELNSKYDALPKEIHWHMIGHLQRNKVKFIVGKTDLIHSVDSLRLAAAISEEAFRQNCIVPILIQVNVAQEESKFGVSLSETIELIKEIAKFPNIQIQGLMTIAPFVENQEENRKTFKTLKKLSIDIAAKSINNVVMAELSMGMTGDYTVAIEEGATMVRVGTGIFGERNYNR